jgi:hypothetical protein
MHGEGFSCLSGILSSVSDGDSYPHIQVCEISIYPTGTRNEGQSVGGASDAPAASIQDMGVNHRGTNVVVSEKLLNCPDIITVFQQVGREGVT